MANRFERFLTGVANDVVAPVVTAVDDIRTIPRQREETRQQKILREAQEASARAGRLRLQRQPVEDERQMNNLERVAGTAFDFQNRGADAEVGRTQRLQSSQAGVIGDLTDRTVDAAGRLHSTRTSDQIRLANETFGPIRGLAESGMSHDREMARMFIGDTPLINSMNDTALAMQGRNHDLVRELNQKTGLEKLVGPLSQIAALAYLFT